MRKKDLFDEVIEFLQESKEACPFAELSPGLFDAFFSDAKASSRPSAPAPAPQPRQAPAHSLVRETPPAVSGEHSVISALRSKVAACTACRLCETRKNTVFGDGNLNAELMFIGEAPGEEEDIQGLPFVGKAGELLDRMIAAMQFSRKEVYIANIVKCRPPSNRAPFDDEIERCLPFLLKQIDQIRPKVLVLLGAVPLKALMNMSGITKIHGRELDYSGIKVIPTFHPAYLLRNPPAKKDAWEDLQKAMALFGKFHKK